MTFAHNMTPHMTWGASKTSLRAKRSGFDARPNLLGSQRKNIHVSSISQQCLITRRYITIISPLYHYCFWLYPMKITVDSYEQIPLAKYSTNGLSYHHDIPIILWFSIAMVNYQRVSHYITIILDTLPIELVIFHTHGFISPLCSHHHTYSNDIPIVSPLYIYIYIYVHCIPMIFLYNHKIPFYPIKCHLNVIYIPRIHILFSFSVASGPLCKFRTSPSAMRIRAGSTSRCRWLQLKSTGGLPHHQKQHIHHTCHITTYTSWGVPWMVAGWFLSWNILLKWMIWEYPYLRKSPYVLYIWHTYKNTFIKHVQRACACMLYTLKFKVWWKLGEHFQPSS